MHPQIGTAGQVAQPHAWNKVQEFQQLRSLVPGIADQPLVSALPGQHDFLATGVHAGAPACRRAAQEVSMTGASAASISLG